MKYSKNRHYRDQEKTIEKDSDIEYGWKEDEGSIDTCWGIVAERCSRDKNRELTLAPNAKAQPASAGSCAGSAGAQS